MRIGHLACYPNGTLAFENYADMGTNGLDGPLEVNLSDGRFIRRTIGSMVDKGYGSLMPARNGNGSDMRSGSMARVRENDQATKGSPDKRS